ncbi:hypothetical protein [Adhaeribacter pallidiroseus]|uniref:Uncharacterized protein n=1 Tax=Adhaeribacter pallidiroseus TaxID=2072847 RepID=A0A369QNT2_9BACT|nr:hypothetical protein [Adhaeribacter pallidiroseus]RDC64509.1 hypothetical protein AHMF7616_03123 [Adhaeribacter pallidiroseus]
MLEYKLGLNDKMQEYDLIILKLYEVDPFLQVKAYDFTKSEVPLCKSATQIESTLNLLVQNYPTDTKIPYPENGPLYCGSDYLLRVEFSNGEESVIDFTPFRITKGLEELVNFLEAGDYKTNFNLIGEPVNKLLLSNQYKMIIKQRVGIMEYPKVVSLETILQQYKKDKLKQE